MRNFTIALSDALISSIKMSNVCRFPSLFTLAHLYLQYEDSDIAFIKGRISIPTNTGIPVLEPLRVDPKQSEDIEMVDATAVIKTMPRAVMIGDLKLTGLKIRLNKLGISADFAGEGVLVCRNYRLDADVEDTVAVRKTKRGEVRVEGDASALFYSVRDEIYKLHALVETE